MGGGQANHRTKKGLRKSESGTNPGRHKQPASGPVLSFATSAVFASKIEFRRLDKYMTKRELAYLGVLRKNAPR
jgi:hypothetical protein